MPNIAKWHMWDFKSFDCITLIADKDGILSMYNALLEALLVFKLTQALRNLGWYWW